MNMKVDYANPVKATGIQGVLRECNVPVPEISRAAEAFAARCGKDPAELSLIVCCLDDMISAAACRDGRIVDGTDCPRGEGPMSPVGCGTMTVSDVIDLCYSGLHKEKVVALCCGEGGLVSHFGTKDHREVRKMADEGDKEAALVYEAMIYQSGKVIGEMAAALKGKVDAILLTGPLAEDQRLTAELARKVEYISSVQIC